jgi:large subunit ribosomal protein L18
MSLQKRIQKRRIRRAFRNRKGLKGSATVPRISVFRSLKHIHVQVINDSADQTIVSCSSEQLKDAVGDKKALSRAVGRELAARAQAKGITRAIFDRGSFLYHGRVKELAEGIREGGLKI